MTESIFEGTLKQILKQPGDYVEASEDVAVIKADRIDIGVFAPMAGTIKELLVSEQDTVIVSQDMICFEVGVQQRKLADEDR
ncbi:hypothetical protein K470DRAFT_254912 [Piedraia hortae CBS 480.64]|uniref:Lipoyl-binding domain-containing protein n=1 Tax=Piedraia hortae CBS 480.64 TaxID=1314780 RepID=A0A6A7C866_9PEZI|nr:hypothetical protein K470DRAFT_254912 [Piedraia hortae CBS 480.64]